jgi:hypothetical protein
VRHQTTVAASVLLGCVLVGCAYSAAPIDRAEAPTPAAKGAQNMLGAMYQRYISARSYEDHGTVVSIIRPDDDSEPSTGRWAFNTAFVRATGSFRFEYTTTRDKFLSPDQQVIWRAGSGQARVWWTISPHQVESADLETGLAAMAGVSGSTSHTVPSMLLGWAAGMKRDLGYVADGEGLAGSVACVKMSARRGRDVTTLWIDKDDHSLRKVTKRNHHDGVYSEEDIARLVSSVPEEHRAEVLALMRKPRPFVSDTTIDYLPSFDRTIEPSRFEFIPPPASADDAVPR